MAKRKPANSDLVVKPENTFDPADYVMVHKDYLDRILSALKRIAADDGAENCHQDTARLALGNNDSDGEKHE